MSDLADSSGSSESGATQLPAPLTQGSSGSGASTPPDPYEGAVPPGYDWPTHGGYLGCLLSLMASCLIGGFLGSTLFAALSYHQILPQPVTITLTVAVYLVIIVGLGRLGWVLGRRFYRQYTPPDVQTWGEHDDYTPEGAEPPYVVSVHEHASDEHGDDTDDAGEDSNGDHESLGDTADTQSVPTLNEATPANTEGG